MTGKRVTEGGPTLRSEKDAAIKREPSNKVDEEGMRNVNHRVGQVMFGNVLRSHWQDFPTFPNWCAYQESLPRDEGD